MRTRQFINANAEKLADKRRTLKEKQFKRQHEAALYYPDDRRATADDFHSSGTPCCAPALRVMEKIFPEIVPSQTKRGGAADANVGTSSTTSGDAKGGGDVAAASGGSDVKTNDGNAGGDDGGVEEKTEVDLLAKLIRKHLLDERRKVRGPSAAGGGSKKKRKKKKKGGPTTAAAAATERGQDESCSPPKDYTASKDSISPSGVANLSPATSRDEPGDPATAAIAAADAPPEQANGSEDASKASLGRFLDNALQGDADRKHPPPQNRDLVAFVDYLNSRYRTYVHQQDALTSGNGKRSDRNERIYKSVEIIPSIHYKLLERYGDSPSCLKCRKLCQAIINNHNEGGNAIEFSFTLHEKCMHVPTDLTSDEGLTPFDILMNTEEGFEIERAFDYVALEEGMHSDSVDDSKNPDGAFKLVVRGEVKHRSPTALNESGRIKSEHVVERAQGHWKRRPEFLELVPPSVTGNDQPSILSLEDVVRLVNQVLIPGGLDLSTVEGKRSNGAEEREVKDLYSIDTMREITHNSIGDTFQQTSKTMQQLQFNYDKVKELEREARETYSIGDLNAKSSNALRNCDEACDVYFNRAVTFVHFLSKISVGLCSVEGRVGDWARDLIYSAIDLICTAHSELIEPVINYKLYVSNASKRPGAVPSISFFVSSIDEFRTMMDLKVRTIDTIHRFLQEKLLSPSPHYPELNGILCFCAASMYHAFPPETPVISPSGADDMTVDILKRRQNLCWESYTKSEVVKGGLVKGAIEGSFTLTKQLDAFEKQLGVENIDIDDVESNLGPITNLITRQVVREDHLGTRRNADSEFLARFQLEQTDDAETINHATAEIEYNNRRATVLLFQWWIQNLRKYRQCQQKMFNGEKVDLPYDDAFISSLRSYPRQTELPRNLVKWLKENHSGDNIERPRAEEEVSSCTGRCAVRRVSCLVAVMLYDWLQDRCVEWNAELTQKELLAAMEIDEGFFASEPLTMSNANKASGNSSKKKKKKTKKKSSSSSIPPTKVIDEVESDPKADANEEGGLDRLIECEQDTPKASLTDTSKSSKGTSEVKEEVSLDAVAVGTGYNIDDPGNNDDDGFSLVNSRKKTGKIKDKSNANDSKEQRKEQHEALEESPREERENFVSKVSVKDGSELIPAEYYLVRRLKTIMNKSKSDKSSIVFL